MVITEQDIIDDRSGVDSLIGQILKNNVNYDSLASLYLHAINRQFDKESRRDFLLLDSGFSFLSFSGSLDQKLIVGVLAKEFKSGIPQDTQPYVELTDYIKKTFCINREDFNKKATFFDATVSNFKINYDLNFFALSFVTEIKSDLCCRKK